MNLSGWPEPDLNAPELPPLTSSTETVLETITGSRVFDTDGLDRIRWADLLLQTGIFEDLTITDYAAIISAVLQSRETISNHLKKEILQQIEEILEA